MFSGNYIFRFPHNDNEPIYKIGKSNDIIKRYATLSTSYYEPIIENLFIYPSNNALYTGGYLYFTEKKLHEHFASKRINPKREFFKINKIENELKEFIVYMDSIGINLILTKDLKDLKNVKDLSYDEPKENSDEILLSLGTIELSNSDSSSNEDKLYEPYPEQLEIIEKINTVLNENFIGKLILPPGLGKSYLTSFYIKKYMQDKIILILVPQILIGDSFEEALIKCGNNNITVVNGETNESLSNKPGIYISTYQTMILQLNIDIHFDLIIYDECHHLCAKSFKKTIDLKSTKRLFLTATPKLYEIDDTHGDVDITFDMNDPKFGNVIFEDNIGNCIQQGKLCDYKIFICDWTNGVKSVCEKLKKSYNRKKIIMFFNKIAMSENIYNSLKEFYNIFHIDGNTPKKEKAEILKKFRETEFSILCNVNMVGEGVNIPEIDAIIFMEKRQSAIGIIQNVGRGLRKYKDKDFCMILMTEDMADKKVLTNLYQNDNRLINKSMYISDIKDYNIEGLIKIIKISDEADNFWRNCNICYEVEKEGLDLSESVIVNGILIGDWLSNIKRRYLNKELHNDEKLKAMFEINFIKKWKENTKDGELNRKGGNDRSFEAMMNRCLKYEEINKNKKSRSKRLIDKGNIIGRDSIYDGVMLYGWFQNHTRAYRRKLNNEIKDENDKYDVSDDENEEKEEKEENKSVSSNKFIITKKIKINNKILKEHELTELKKLKTFQNFLKYVDNYKQIKMSEEELIDKCIRYEKLGNEIKQGHKFEGNDLKSLLNKRLSKYTSLSEDRKIKLRQIKKWVKMEDKKLSGKIKEPEISVDDGVKACMDYEKIHGIVYKNLTYFNSKHKLNMWVNRKIQDIRHNDKFNSIDLLKLRNVEKIKNEIDAKYHLEELKKLAKEEELIEQENIKLQEEINKPKPIIRFTGIKFREPEQEEKAGTITYKIKSRNSLKHPKEEASDSDAE
jgi:superfamily II DNA or RNA helicase